MILVTENAEKKLALKIEQFQRMLPHMRCIHFAFSQARGLPDNMMTQLADVCRLVWPDSEGLVFQCLDRDVFILAPDITQKSFLLLLSGLAAQNSGVPFPSFSSLFEVGIEGKKIMDTVQAKILRIAEEEKRRLAEEQEALRRSIMNMPINEALLQNMNVRRKGRKKPEVLVIEDDPFTQSLVGRALGGIALVSAAVSAKEAIEKYPIIAPDVVFLDIALPDATGHDVLRRLREIDPDSYIVMFSGNGNQENIVRAVSAGAKGFVGKPFTRDKLIYYINKNQFQNNREITGV